MGKPKTSKPHRSEAQEEADRRNIARLYLSGMYQAQIAEELGISQPTVSRDINYLIAEWKVERIYDINEAKARELAKIDNLELEYWDAWRQSKKDAEIKTKKALKIGAGLSKAELARLAGILPEDTIRALSSGLSRQELQEVIRGQVGDRGFLQGVQWCIEQRCKILGVEAPKKLAGDPDNPLEVRIIEVVKSYEKGKE